MLQFGQQRAQTRVGCQRRVPRDQLAHAGAAEAAAFGIAHIGRAVGERIHRAAFELDFVLVERDAGHDAERRSAGRVFGERATPIDQHRRKSGAGELHGRSPRDRNSRPARRRSGRRASSRKVLHSRARATRPARCHPCRPSAAGSPRGSSAARHRDPCRKCRRRRSRCVRRQARSNRRSRRKSRAPAD